MLEKLGLDYMSSSEYIDELMEGRFGVNLNFAESFTEIEDARLRRMDYEYDSVFNKNQKKQEIQPDFIYKLDSTPSNYESNIESTDAVCNPFKSLENSSKKQDVSTKFLYPSFDVDIEDGTIIDANSIRRTAIDESFNRRDSILKTIREEKESRKRLLQASIALEKEKEKSRKEKEREKHMTWDEVYMKYAYHLYGVDFSTKPLDSIDPRFKASLMSITTHYSPNTAEFAKIYEIFVTMTMEENRRRQHIYQSRYPEISSFVREKGWFKKYSGAYKSRKLITIIAVSMINGGIIYDTDITYIISKLISFQVNAIREKEELLERNKRIAIRNIRDKLLKYEQSAEFYDGYSTNFDDNNIFAFNGREYIIKNQCCIKECVSLLDAICGPIISISPIRISETVIRINDLIVEEITGEKNTNAIRRSPHFSLIKKDPRFQFATFAILRAFQTFEYVCAYSNNCKELRGDCVQATSNLTGIFGYFSIRDLLSSACINLKPDDMGNSIFEEKKS